MFVATEEEKSALQTCLGNDVPIDVEVLPLPERGTTATLKDDSSDGSGAAFSDEDGSDDGPATGSDSS